MAAQVYVYIVPRLDTKISKDTINSSINDAFTSLGYKSPTEDQTRVVFDFIAGKDLFVVLPTGSGKSLCFVSLPLVFDRLGKEEGLSSIILVVSPLISLMKDQVEKYSGKGVKCAYIGQENESDSPSLDESILKGEYHILYSSPESLLGNNKWRDMLSSPVYQKNLVAIVVDEAHCVDSW